MLLKSTVVGSTQKAEAGGSQTLGQPGKQRCEEQEESRGAPQVVVGDCRSATVTKYQCTGLN